MKKTLIALSLTSLFSAASVAAFDVNASDIHSYVKENTLHVVTDSSGKQYAIDGKESDHTSRDIQVRKIAKELGLKRVHEDSDLIRVNKGDYTGWTVNEKTGQVTDKRGKHAGYIEVDSKGSINIKPVDPKDSGATPDMNPSKRDPFKYADTRIQENNKQLMKAGQDYLEVAADSVQREYMADQKRRQDASVAASNARWEQASINLEQKAQQVADQVSRAYIEDQKVRGGAVEQEFTKVREDAAVVTQRAVEIYKQNNQQMVKAGEEAVAQLRKEIAESSNNNGGNVTPENVEAFRNEIRKEGAEAFQVAGEQLAVRSRKAMEQYTSAAEKHLETEYAKVEAKATEALTAQVQQLQAQIDELKKNGGADNSKVDTISKNTEKALKDMRAEAAAEVKKMREEAAQEVANIRKEIEKANGGNNTNVDGKIDAKIDAAGKHINEAGAIAYNDLDNKIGANTARIDNLEQNMKAMGDQMLNLEDRMDGVVATSHAVTNARPMVQDAGEFAMGVGIGAAGSKQALALGGAYQFNANWSSSMTVNYETAGKRSNSQLSAGAGVQYRFK